MPSISATWEVPHPCLRPVPKPEALPYPAPTPETPFCPVHATNRIPVPFSILGNLAQVACRLAQSPRTVPIRGMITRRLLTLSPHLVDLSQYHEMDLEELRRYDRRLVWGLLHGLEPYPWYPDRHPGYVPSAKMREALLESQAPELARLDADRQGGLLYHGYKTWQEDTVWETERLAQVRAENVRRGRVYHGPDDAHLHEYDRIMEAMGVSVRQYLEVWARRMESAAADPDYADKCETLERMRTYDRMCAPRPRRRATDNDTDTDVEMAPAPTLTSDPYAGVPAPFQLGAPVFEIPERLPYWGPDAVWDGYRLHGGVPTGKTLNEYAAELSTCVDDDGKPWPPMLPESLKRKFEEAEQSDDSEEESDEDGEGENEEEVEEGPPRKRARTEEVLVSLQES